MVPDASLLGSVALLHIIYQHLTRQKLERPTGNRRPAKATWLNELGTPYILLE